MDLLVEGLKKNLKQAKALTSFSFFFRGNSQVETNE